MSTQQPGLEFDAVVRIGFNPNWLQLDNKDPLVRLHSKFWGKNLTSEEPELSNEPHTESGTEENHGRG